MFVAVCRLELHIAMASSLKDKRAVVQSTVSRVRAKFPVSIAEVEALSNLNVAVLGIAALSNEAGHALHVVEAVVRHVERLRLDAEVGHVDYETLVAL